MMTDISIYPTDVSRCLGEIPYILPRLNRQFATSDSFFEFLYVFIYYSEFRIIRIFKGPTKKSGISDNPEFGLSEFLVNQPLPVGFT